MAAGDASTATGTPIPGEEVKGPDAVESLAREMGWRPEEEYTGPEWVDAATFIKRGGDIQKSMQQQLKSQKRQMSDMQAGLEALRHHNERVYKAEITKMKNQVDEIKQQRREAIESADPDLVETLDKQLGDIQKVVSESEALIKSDPVKTASSDNPDFDSWVERNAWYQTDTELTAYADAQAESNPALKGLPYGRWLQKIESLVKESFPEKFQQKAAPGGTTEGTAEGPALRHNTVEGGHGRTGQNTRSKFTETDLGPEQRDIMNTFVKSGVMTKEEYIADLVSMGELS